MKKKTTTITTIDN